MTIKTQKKVNRDNKGFTLVEVLVSLVILSLIMLTIVASMRTFGKSQIAIEGVTQRTNDIRVVSRFLRNSLEVMLRSELSDSGGVSAGGGLGAGGSMYFEGSNSELSWHATLMFGETAGGAMALKLEKEGNNLILRWQNIPENRQAYEWNQANSKILLEGLSSFELQYRPEYGEDWEDNWELRPGTPVMVRMSLKVGERYWPEIVVAL